MDLDKIIIENKDGYYNLAMEYFYKISIEDYESESFNVIVPKSISILVDHNFIPAPCVEIRLVFLQDEKEVGGYFLYVDEQKNIIDEFLILQ